MNLSNNAKLILVNPAAEADTNTLTLQAIDMQGFDGVSFFGTIATADAGNYVKARQDVDSDMGAAQDLEGTKLVVTDDGKAFLLDIYRPKERYVDIQIVRGVETAVGDVYALLYGSPRRSPVEQADMVDALLCISPAEGTA